MILKSVCHLSGELRWGVYIGDNTKQHMKRSSKRYVDICVHNRVYIEKKSILVWMRRYSTKLNFMKSLEKDTIMYLNVTNKKGSRILIYQYTETVLNKLSSKSKLIFLIFVMTLFFSIYK